MYFFRDDTSPNDLIWEEIAPDGSIGARMDSPFHSSQGIQHPIRVAPDGSIVLLGSGRLYDATTLDQVDTLSNDVDDGSWLGDTLYTLRSTGAESEVQKWGPNFGIATTRVVNGTPLRLFSSSPDRLLVITEFMGMPWFTVLDENLKLSEELFADGFESGDLAAWSSAQP